MKLGYHKGTKMTEAIFGKNILGRVTNGGKQLNLVLSLPLTDNLEGFRLKFHMSFFY